MQLNIIRTRLTTLLLAAMAAGLLFAMSPLAAQAFFSSAPVDLEGYAWSSTIGWISLGNDPNEQVTINTDGTVTGYAWSENVGWLQFGGLSNFPQNIAGTIPKNAELVDVGGGNYELQGWAKFAAGDSTGTGVSLALDVLRIATGLTPSGTMSSPNSYDVNDDAEVNTADALDVLRVAVGLPAAGGKDAYIETLITEYSNLNPSPAGGWDGWVSLNGDTHSVQFNSAGPVADSYAWGSEVVGWIDMFSHVSLGTAASADLTVTGCTVAAGASTCAGSVAWQFTNASNPVIARTVPSIDTIFSSADTNPTGSANPYTMQLGTNTFEARDDSGVLDTAEVSITNGSIQCTPNASPSGGVCTCDSGYTNSGGVCVATTPECSDGIDNDGDGYIDYSGGNPDPSCSGPNDDSENPFDAPTTPTLNDFTISPPIVRKGQDVTVDWDTTATACTITTTQGDSISGGPTGSEDITITVNNQVIVTLTCDGTELGQETVRVLPTLFES